MHTVRFIIFASAFAVVALTSQNAFAQKIRSYGDQAEAEYGTGQQNTAVQQASGQTGASTATNVTKVDTSPSGQQAAGQQQGADGEQQVDMTSYVTVFQPGGSNAPLPVDLTPDKMYRGVIPGTRDEVSHLVKAREKASDRSNRNAVTWVGFQANEGATRVFFQTGRTSSYDLGQADGALTVTFSDTRLSAGNFARFIDTSYFNRNVTRIEVKQTNRTTVVAKIFMRSFEQPDVDRNGNYLYLDFSGSEMKSDSGSTSSESTEE